MQENYTLLLKELRTLIEKLFVEINKEKHISNKSSRKRARIITNEIGKKMKEFRKVSMSLNNEKEL